MAHTRTFPHKKATDNTTLSCMQLNLQHSKPATNKLNLLMQEAHMDLALVQEPYIYQNQVTGISLKYWIFSSGKGKKRAAIMVTNKSIDALLIHQISEEDIVVIEVTHGNKNFIVASIYLDIRKEITEDFNKIKNILQLAKGEGIISGDRQ